VQVCCEYGGGFCYIMYIMMWVQGRFKVQSIQYFVCTGEVPAT
jgi:hypothetical protein